VAVVVGELGREGWEKTNNKVVVCFGDVPPGSPLILLHPRFLRRANLRRPHPFGRRGGVGCIVPPSSIITFVVHLRSTFQCPPHSCRTHRTPVESTGVGQESTGLGPDSAGMTGFHRTGTGFQRNETRFRRNNTRIRLKGSKTHLIHPI